MYIKGVNYIAAAVAVVVVMFISLCMSNEVVARDKGKQVSGRSSVMSAELESQIIATANYYKLDPKLLKAIISQESGFNAKATSNKGAMGLMQMIPSTAKRFGVTNPYDPKQSLDGGSRYLVWLLRRYNGRLDLALAGYNAGEGAVERYGNRVPPYKETQGYVRSITFNYLSKLSSSSSSSSSNIKQVGSTYTYKRANPINSVGKTKTFSKKEINQLAKLDGLFEWK
jgi:hypothetical protein